MKSMFQIFTGLVAVLCMSFGTPNLSPQSDLNGAWRLQTGSVEQILILSDGYFMHSTFDKAGKKLHDSRGGTFRVAGDKMNAAVEFNINNKDQIGEKLTYSFNKSGSKLTTDLGGQQASWTQLNAGEEEMAGTWRHSGRKQNGTIVMSQPRARKTLKVLNGGRFQWAAINAETKEFFGTGGGSYTFKDGKYSETIEFFSRDSSRVGVSLTFDGKLVDGNWHHSGKNSTGGELYEVWVKEDN